MVARVISRVTHTGTLPSIGTGGSLAESGRKIGKMIWGIIRGNFGGPTQDYNQHLMFFVEFIQFCFQREQLSPRSSGFLPHRIFPVLTYFPHIALLKAFSISGR